MKHPITQVEVFQRRAGEALRTRPATTSSLSSGTDKRKEVWELVQAVKDWSGVSIVPDPGGLCLSLDDVTLGHLRWDGRLDLPFHSEVRKRLLAEGMASPDPDQPDSGRLVFDVRTLRDVDRAVWLLRLAYLSLDSKLRVCATQVAPVPADGE
jgi:hypothetical protein